jgi:hypothetical protein
LGGKPGRLGTDLIAGDGAAGKALAPSRGTAADGAATVAVTTAATATATEPCADAVPQVFAGLGA